MLKNIKQITYRGSLKSCNYTCEYCPFSKNSIFKVELQKDEKNLNNFIKKLDETKFNNEVEIFFTPYGEGLIHSYYKNSICELSNKNYINKIGCQTNLSFDVDSWLKLNMNFDKVYLWTTFHPTMTSVDDFVKKVFVLEKHNSISVGVVANPDDIDIIIKLRKKLPINIYMWINAMDGLDRNYTHEEIKVFTKIDPMFKYQIYKLDDYTCNCGDKHIFIKSSGKIYNCNKNRNVIGDIYKSDELKKIDCKGKNCDCYLAYSHTKEFLNDNFFVDTNLFRIPTKVKAKAIFFDIDGTLVEDKETLEKTFDYISNKIPIYLATELPENIAYKKIGFLRKYISGGIFAGGSYVVDYKKDFKYIEEVEKLSESFLKKVLEDRKSSIYEDDNKIYRVITQKSLIEESKENINAVAQKNGMISIVAKDVDKLYGIKILCKFLNLDLETIMCVGNEKNDISMLSNCGYPVSVLDSCEQVKKISKYNVNTSHIPYLV